MAQNNTPSDGAGSNYIVDQQIISPTSEETPKQLTFAQADSKNKDVPIDVSGHAPTNPEGYSIYSNIKDGKVTLFAFILDSPIYHPSISHTC
jgi:hypothetical protein